MKVYAARREQHIEDFAGRDLWFKSIINGLPWFLQISRVDEDLVTVYRLSLSDVYYFNNRWSTAEVGLRTFNIYKNEFIRQYYRDTVEDALKAALRNKDFYTTAELLGREVSL